MYDKSTFHGIDPQYSRQQARAMQTGAGDLDRIVGQIGSLLSQVQWSGPGAQRFLGDGAQWDPIYNANREAIENAAKQHGRSSSDQGHWIYAGTKLTIRK